MNQNETKKVLSKFVVGYNKGIVLNTVNGSSMKIIRNNMDEISESLDDVLAAVEEISATAESTSQNTSKIEQSMKQLTNRNHDVNVKIENTTANLKDTRTKAGLIQEGFEVLEERSESIKGISTDIQDVAEETNVLAINASIEAARAGEAGRGFRIVAGEVRKMSQKTHNFADQITKDMGEFLSTLHSMSQDMDQFMKDMKQFSLALEDVQSVFSANSDTATQTAEQVAQIVLSIQEQSKALQMGMKSLIQVDNLVKDSNTITEVLKKSHTALDDLLQ
jgi:methyl-accepting chemotaxis protein